MKGIADIISSVFVLDYSLYKTRNFFKNKQVILYYFLQCDAEIARALFTVVLQSLMEKTDDSGVFIENITEAANKIFTTSFQYNPSVIGAFLDLAVEHKDSIKFQPELIATVCQSSGLVSTGIALFEDYLLSSLDTGEPNSKRSRNSNNLENDCWIYLSE